MLLSAFAVLASAPCLSARAKGENTLYMTSADGNAGETVTIAVGITGGAKSAGGGWALVYDTTALKLESYALTNQSLLSTDECSANTGNGKFLIDWAAGPKEAEGELIALTFRISDSAPAGNYTISFDSSRPGISEFYDENADTIGVLLKSGTISVISGGSSGAAVSAADSGGQSACVTEEEAAALIESAKRAESAGEKAEIAFRAAGSGVSSGALMIPGALLGRIADETDAGLTVNSELGAITFGPAAVETIARAAGSEDITIEIKETESAALPEKARKEAEGRPVYELTVKAGDTGITDFAGGVVTVRFPYTLKAGEDQNSVVVYLIDGTGELRTVRGAYSQETGTVVLKTTHFSNYMIGYRKVAFTDVPQDSWYAGAVGFLAARGITTGNGAGLFLPESTLTRGQFVVMLLRAYGIDPADEPGENFSDAGNTYYTDYLAAAKKLEISNGVGGNRFAPEENISRQDMVTLLYRALAVLGELPQEQTGGTLEQFADSGEIAAYAREAVKTFVECGVISGSGGRLNPGGSTTRSQMAQVLYNLLSE